MLQYVDTHCHLDLAQFDGKIPQIIENARNAGVGRMINPAIHVRSSERIAAICDENPEVYGAVGIHPNDVPFNLDKDLESIAILATKMKIVAIGEIGLDAYHQDIPADLQMQAFYAQLELAAALMYPVIVHSRQTMDSVEKILSEWSHHHRSAFNGRYLGVLHAFEGDSACALRMFSQGYLIGLGGPITYKNAEQKRDVIKNLPLDAMVLETDSPYLTPEPLRGKVNEPAYIPLIGQRTAIIKGCSESEIAERTTQNAITLFNIGAVH